MDSTVETSTINGALFELCLDGMGRKLWLNAADGSAVARFNVVTGVDIHNTATDQLKGMSECLWCTHEKPTLGVWIKFTDTINQRFGVVIPLNAIDRSLLL